MRLPDTAHTSRPWRIHELTAGFRLEDVWALPTPGGPHDFPRLIQLMASGDPSRGSSRPVHAVMHVGWVPDQAGGYRGQMAVYVKPDGPLGTGYMAAIRPFRHLIVYPPVLQEMGRRWRALAALNVVKE